MQLPIDPASSADSSIARIDALMHVHPEDALQLCAQVFAATQRREPPAYVRTAERYGKIMDHLGRSNEARNTLFVALQVTQSSAMPLEEAKLLERLARGYYSCGDYRLAVQYWTSCIALTNQAGADAETWVLAKVGLSQVYKSAGDSAAALTMLAEAEPRAREVHDAHLDAKVKINLGVCLIDMQQPAQAAAVLRDAFRVCTEHHLLDYLAESNFYLGKIALAAGELEQAMAYLDAGLAATRSVNFRWCEGHLLAVKADVFARGGQFVRALEVVREAQAIATADGFFDMLIQQHFSAAEYAASLNDYATAFAEYKAGRDCEQRVHAKAPLERDADGNDEAHSQQSLNRLLLDLSDHDVIDHGELEPAFELITEGSCRILGVARVSLWLLDAQIGSLVRRCLHLADGAQGARDEPLRSKDYPVYFQRLSDPHPLVAHDALHHPHTAELINTYLHPHDIRSILVFPIRLSGQTIGTLCFESVGAQRNWTQDDLLHGKQLAEISARVITNYEHKVSREEINALNAKMMRANEMLEERVMERTVSLERHAVELHELQGKLSAMRQGALSDPDPDPGPAPSPAPTPPQPLPEPVASPEQGASRNPDVGTGGPAEERFRDLLHLSSDWSWEQDAQFRITYVDGQVLEKSGLTREFMLGKRFWDFPVSNLGVADWEAHREKLGRREPFIDLELHLVDANASQRWIAISGQPVFDEQGQYAGYRGIGKEITERKLNEDRIHYLATHDALTSLPNRSLFSEFLNRTIQAGRRYERRFAVAFIDLDRFKIINDTLGHDAGDTLLKTISLRLQECLRVSDVVARLGGDEFVVLLQEIEDEEHAGAVANKILAAVLKPVMLLGQECRVTASIGICMYSGEEDEEAMMKNADIAMYRAKEDGKNNFRFFNEELASKSMERMVLESSLRHAVESNQLFLNYQAKQELNSGAITGVEARVQWRHPELGDLEPEQFMPLAEETGLIIGIGRWVLLQACLQNVAWQRAGVAPISMAVSLSARQFGDETLLGDIQAALQQSGMAPHLLELELTESMVIHNVEHAMTALGGIKQLGVRVAIDDFGTGYSSLAQLKHFPIDTLKLNRSFVQDLPRFAEDQAITRAIIDMGKTLKLRVVAAGVETEEQVAFLRESFCDEIEGFQFTQPIRADQFVALWGKQDPAAL